jgi:inosine/xanthosine triphosphate pyrophosphatase family protein
MEETRNEKPFLVSSNQRKRIEFLRFGLELDVRSGADIKEILAEPDDVAIHKAIAAGPGAIVEDTILRIDGVDVVDVRWRLAELGAAADDAPRAEWIVTLAKNDGENVTLHRGVVLGKIIPPENVPDDAFGFDAHFVPDDAEGRSLHELEKLGVKDKFSARKAAVVSLIENRSSKTVRIAEVPPWNGPMQNEQ